MSFADGMNLIATGAVPAKQASFLNRKENDKKNCPIDSAALESPHSKYIRDENEPGAWIKGLHQAVALTKE